MVYGRSYLQWYQTVFSKLFYLQTGGRPGQCPLKLVLPPQGFAPLKGPMILIPGRTM